MVHSAESKNRMFLFLFTKCHFFEQEADNFIQLLTDVQFEVLTLLADRYTNQVSKDLLTVLKTFSDDELQTFKKSLENNPDMTPLQAQFYVDIIKKFPDIHHAEALEQCKKSDHTIKMRTSSEQAQHLEELILVKEVYTIYTQDQTRGKLYSIIRNTLEVFIFIEARIQRSSEDDLIKAFITENLKELHSIKERFKSGESEALIGKLRTVMNQLEGSSVIIELLQCYNRAPTTDNEKTDLNQRHMRNRKTTHSKEATGRIECHPTRAHITDTGKTDLN